MTGPSAIGSENGTPSSIASAPARSSSSTMRGVVATSGSPHVTYAITPHRDSARRCLKRRLTRFKRPSPGAARHPLPASRGEGQHVALLPARGEKVPEGRMRGSQTLHPHHLRNVFIAPPTQIRDHDCVL